MTMSEGRYQEQMGLAEREIEELEQEQAAQRKIDARRKLDETRKTEEILDAALRKLAAMPRPPLDWKPSMSQRPIAIALAAAQAEFENPVKDSTADVKSSTSAGYTYEYVSLPAVLDMVRPILTKHGIALTQLATNDPMANVVTVSTVLIHGESGDTIESDLSVKAGEGRIQQVGSAITYARRYALISMLGIAAEEDDDGNEAHGNDKATTSRRPAAKPAAKAGNQTTKNDPLFNARGGFEQAMNAAFNAKKLDSGLYFGPDGAKHKLNLVQNMTGIQFNNLDELTASDWIKAENELRHTLNIPRAKPTTVEDPR